MANAEQPNWLVQLLRVTLFTPAPLSDSETLWRTLTGSDPDSDDYRSRELMRRQSGQFADASLEVQTNPARTDIVMGPAESEGLPSFEFGQFQQRVAIFDEMISTWVARLDGDVFRIAFGAIALHPSTSRADAYERLGRYAPSITVDPENSKELIYRVNRPKTGQGGLPLNRIMTWSAARVRMAVLANQTAAQLTDEHYTRLEIDNSTPAERAEPLDRVQLVAIFKELVGMGTENLARGELP